MFAAHVDTDHENERVVVVLEAGSCWSPSVEETRKAAPNALVLAQAPGESPAVFAARVARRLGRLTAEHGRVVRAATLCTRIGESTELAESRRRIIEVLAQGITAGSRVIVTSGDRPKSVRPLLHRPSALQAPLLRGAALTAFGGRGHRPCKNGRA